MKEYIKACAEKVLSGGKIEAEEALKLASVEGADAYFLLGYGGEIRDKLAGVKVDLCSIISAKTGSCSEDCAFCSQSAHHDTDVENHTLLDEDIILKKAKAMEAAGTHRFDIVVSGKGVEYGSKDFDKILNALSRIKEETSLEVCACLGTLTDEAAAALREVGVTRYNHNLETAESYFPEIISTHTYEDRLNTIKAVKKVGMEVCCGGIIGLGESMEQRIELALALRDLDVESIPINILNPIEGTRLEASEPLSHLEILKTIAVFRFILADKIIRYAGGRENALGELQNLGLMAGLNGMLIGGYLTTTGQEVEKDKNIIKSADLKY